MTELGDLHPYFADGSWRCVKCGGRLLETTRRFIGVMTSPRKLQVFHVFGACEECTDKGDWTETRATPPPST
jgi:uncharacterized protein with PIN domain